MIVRLLAVVSLCTVQTKGVPHSQPEVCQKFPPKNWWCLKARNTRYTPVIKLFHISNIPNVLSLTFKANFSEKLSDKVDWCDDFACHISWSGLSYLCICICILICICMWICKISFKHSCFVLNATDLVNSRGNRCIYATILALEKSEIHSDCYVYMHITYCALCSGYLCMLCTVTLSTKGLLNQDDVE